MLDAVLNNFWFVTWFGLWWKFLIAYVIVEIIIFCLMLKYIIRMSDSNILNMIDILEEEERLKQRREEPFNKIGIVEIILAIILLLIPAIAFIFSSISLVRDFSSYERFVAYIEK